MNTRTNHVATWGSGIIAPPFGAQDATTPAFRSRVGTQLGRSQTLVPERAGENHAGGTGAAGPGHVGGMADTTGKPEAPVRRQPPKPPQHGEIGTGGAANAIEGHDDNPLGPDLRCLQQRGRTKQPTAAKIQRQHRAPIPRQPLAQALHGYQRLAADYRAHARHLGAGACIQPQLAGPEVAQPRQDVGVVTGSFDGVQISDVEHLERVQALQGGEHRCRLCVAAEPTCQRTVAVAPAAHRTHHLARHEIHGRYQLEGV